ncbi:MAG TPA: nuclease-related domain-containing protein [Gammaproteobacteria bacterium]|nr:nuclease-related domain-containing protein [Gammaproteobacteria bacterium]
MPDLLQRVSEQVPAGIDRVLMWAPPVLLVAAAGLLLAPLIGPWLGAWRIRRTVRRMASAVMQDVVLPDGVEGTVWIDFLALTPEGIQVLQLKRYPGLIFGGRTIEHWTQVVNRRSHPFPNPLQSLHTDVLAVQSLLSPEVPVQGRVLFTPESRFPRGRPDGVALLQELTARPRKAKTPPASLQQAWDALQGAAQPAASAREVRKTLPGAEGRTTRLLPALLLLLLAAVWTGWWLVRLTQ